MNQPDQKNCAHPAKSCRLQDVVITELPLTGKKKVVVTLMCHCCWKTFQVKTHQQIEDEKYERRGY